MPQFEQMAGESSAAWFAADMTAVPQQEVAL
jgi:hypothetical protein